MHPVKMNLPPLYRLLFSAWLIFISVSLSAQVGDTGRGINPPSGLKADTLESVMEITRIPDSLRRSLAGTGFSNGVPAPDDDVYTENSILGRKIPPVQKRYRKHNYGTHDSAFYALLVLAAMLGLLRSAFARYFDNMFRVFFNTSLKQTQLTEQLLMTPLPSLLFNAFFILSVSLFVYLYLGFSGYRTNGEDWNLLFWIIVFLSGIYLVKFLFIKFLGWVSGMQREASGYIFNVFLVNKILGVCLFPLLPILAFSGPATGNAAVFAGGFLLVLVLSMRFLRSYGLASSGFRIDRFHFLIYFLALEILPLLVIFRIALILLGKMA